MGSRRSRAGSRPRRRSGFGLSEAGRDYSLGWRLTRAVSDAGSLELSVEARRRESANDDDPPEHGIGFAATARW